MQDNMKTDIILTTAYNITRHDDKDNTSINAWNAPAVATNQGDPGLTKQHKTIQTR